MNPLVSICCICYNQEQYIRQALDGFVMQQTNFPYEIVISDDCSRDNTRVIIAEYKTKYPDLIRDVSKEYNQGVIPNWWYVQNCAKGKYIAICEGDDYWTDPLKLQKQVDFLEKNDEYILCCSNAKVYDQLTESYITDALTQSPEGEILATKLAEGNHLHTATAMYKRNARIIKQGQGLGNLGVGDYVLWLLCSKYGKIYRLGEEMSVYRRMSGMWTNMEDIKKQILFLISLCKVRAVLDNPEVLKVLDEQIEFNKKCAFDIADSMAHTKISKSYRLGYAILHPWSLFRKKKK